MSEPTIHQNSHTVDGKCTVCDQKLNIEILGFNHADTCWVMLKQRIKFYEKAFASLWNLLVLTEMGVVSPEALLQLRDETARIVFGYEQSPELLMKASIESVLADLDKLQHQEGT